MRSACGCAAWCFHSFGHACGRADSSGIWHRGVPDVSTGSTVQAVKSVAIATICAASTPLAAIAAGTAVVRTATQSAGFCSAQSGGRSVVAPGSQMSMTASAYSWTAEPTSAPSPARTTTASGQRAEVHPDGVVARPRFAARRRIGRGEIVHGTTNQRVEVRTRAARLCRGDGAWQRAGESSGWLWQEGSLPRPQAVPPVGGDHRRRQNDSDIIQCWEPRDDRGRNCRSSSGRSPVKT